MDLTLGEGMRHRGALCDRILQTSQGVAYVVLDHDPTPMRVRFPYVTDDDIAELAHTYRRLRAVDNTDVIDGEIEGDADGGAA